MYIDTIPNRKSPPAILLRESYRKNGKVNKRTISNLSKMPKNLIDVIKAALNGKVKDIKIHEGKPESGPVFAVLDVLNTLLKQTGLDKILGLSRHASLAKFLIFARIAHQGSRLSAVRWAKNHAVKEVLDLNFFNEDDLYDALQWIASKQNEIEDRLYKRFVKESGKPPALVLYDVTSSYLEGELNELAAFGYNRDGKKGKKQIVIGLLTAPDGNPLSVEVFEGNTSDCETVNNQIKKIVDRFHVKEIIFVGDRGMVKAKAQEKLDDSGFKYITALTDPQVRTLLKRKIIQPGLFDENIVEVADQEKRYVLRRDDITYRKEQYRREDKLLRLKALVVDRNKFVSGSLKADLNAGLNKLNKWIKRHNISSFLSLSLSGKEIVINIDAVAKEQDGLLDGCYCISSNVDKNLLDAQNIHDRYRDLQNVERDFRTIKTGLLEIRPIFLRKELRTKGHVFISMLALKLTRIIEQKLHAAFGTTDTNKSAITVEDMIAALSRICLLYYKIADQFIPTLPEPDSRQSEILSALGIELNAPKASSSKM